MDDVLKIITAITALVAAIGVVVNQIKLARVDQRGKETHYQLNSRLSELVEAVRGKAHAEGVAQGKAEREGQQIAPPLP